MPHVTIRWRPQSFERPSAGVPTLTTMPEEVIRGLAKQMPEICAPALSVPGGRQYPPSGIVVKVDRQSDMDINIPPILIEIFATGAEEQINRRAEAKDQIIEGIRAYLGEDVAKQGSVWLLLPPTSFGLL